MSEVMIEARGLTKRYGPQRALDNASFDVSRGEIVGFLGPNGAGKSTTMRILTCFIAPSEGTAKVNGCDIWQDPIGALKRAIEPLAPPEPKVDRYLTLPGLSALTRGYRPGKAPPPASAVEPLDGRIKAAIKGPWPTVPYWDPGRARIAVKRPGDEARVTVFTFERRALFTWKLVHVQLPEGER